MALEFVKGLDTKSRVAKRLWKAIQDLRDVGERLGILSRVNYVHDEEDSHQTARTDRETDTRPSETAIPVYRGDSIPMTGMEMSAELTNLLETVGMYDPLTVTSAQEDDGKFGHHSRKGPSLDHTTATQWNTADGLFEIMDPLFWNQ